MQRRAANFAIKAELGREPIFSFICSQAFRYWRKLISLDYSSKEILNAAYESELETHKSGNISWVTFIAKLLDSITSDHFLNTTNNVVTKGQMGRLNDKLKHSYHRISFNTTFRI